VKRNSENCGNLGEKIENESSDKDEYNSGDDCKLS
jgi:hypothetical protein